MALNLKNVEVEELAAEVASLTGESKTEAVRRSLLERRDRLRLAGLTQRRAGAFLRFLEADVWPNVPEEKLGKAPSKREIEKLLGFGRAGV